MIRADTAPGSTDSIRSVTFAPDSRRIAVLFANRDVRIYATPVDASEPWSGRELQRLSVPGRRFPVAITELAFSPDGTRLVTGGAGGNVYVWSLSGD